MFKTELTPPFRALSALALMLFFTTAACGYTTKDYVHDGLTVFYDGIVNMGYDAETGEELAHNSSATVWKDLSGNERDAHADADTTAKAWKWNDKAFLYTKNYAKPCVRLPLDFTSLTVEMLVVTNTATAHNTDGYPYTVLAANGEFTGEGSFYFHYQKGSKKLLFRNASGSYCPNLLYGPETFAGIADGHKLSCWSLSGGRSSLTTPATFVHDACTGWVYIGATQAGACFPSDTCTMRVYSRPLSEDELTWNSRLDSVRYRGADPDSVYVKVENTRNDAFGTTVSPIDFGNAVVSSATGTEFALSGVEKDAESGDWIVPSDLGEGHRVGYAGYVWTRSCPGVDYYATGSGTSPSFTVDVKDLSMRVTFDVRKESLTTVTSDGGGTLRVRGAAETVAFPVKVWTDDAANIEIEAVPNEGYRFSRWEGADAGACISDPFNPVVSVPCAGTVRSFKAVFVSTAHQPTVCVWNGGASGSWTESANWQGGVPQDGDTARIEGAQVVVGGATASLAALEVGEGASLVLSNWFTCVRAEAITVGAGGVVKCVGAFTNNEMSNRVWLAGKTLTVEEGGAIRADAAGYAGQNGPAWKGITPTTHKAECGMNVYGGSYGGKQGTIEVATFGQDTYLQGPQPYGSAEWPFQPGSGAGYIPQAAGGAIFLDFSGAVTVNGEVTADSGMTKMIAGNKNQTHSGHGSGGGIVIVCDSISGAGKVTANSTRTSPGSDTAVNSAGGGGGGGRIAVHYDPQQQTADCDIVFEAYCKVTTTTPESVGQPGTVWFPDWKFVEAGKIYNARLASAAATVNIPGNLTVTDQRFGFVADAPLTVNVGGNLAVSSANEIPRFAALSLDNVNLNVQGDAALTSGEIILREGSAVTVVGDFAMTSRTPADAKYNAILYAYAVPGTDADDWFTTRFSVGGAWTMATATAVYPYISDVDTNPGAPLFQAGNLTVDAGAMFDARKRGFGWTQARIPIGKGPAGVTKDTAPKGTRGAGHGGLGAGSVANAPKQSTYDSETEPHLAGSSAKGGSFYNSGGYGGGVIRLVVDNALVLNGDLNAKGWGAGGGGCGGAGGSIWITALAFSGSGTVMATGGSSANSSNKSAGGGGRIAVYTSPGGNTFFDPENPDPAKISAACGTSYSDDLPIPATDGTLYYSIITYTVTSSSSAETELGVPTPGYGQTVSGSPVITLDLAGAIDIGGETYYTNGHGRVAAKFSSATLMKAGSLPETITSIPATRTINDGAKIVWNFDSVHYLLSASAEEGGRVKIDDGAAATAVSNWVAKSGSATVTAVPDDGSMFVSWLGETNNLSGATSVATFTSDAPAAIGARFRSADGYVWTGGAVGRWDDPANWGGAVPAEGKEVIIGATDKDITVILDESPAALSRLRILGNGSRTATLLVSNWTTCLSADEIRIGAGGVIKCAGAFTDNEMSNRVWLAGNTLTVEEGGAIRADAAGYAGQNGPAWVGISKGVHKPNGGMNVYGGSYGGQQGTIEAATFGQESYQKGPRPYGSAEWPFQPGSGAGYIPQAAGGAIFLDFTGAVTVNGEVTADSGMTRMVNGTTVSGHGSGGGIVIVCDSISGAGKVTANSTRTSSGSTSEVPSAGGGGGGGRIAVHYDSAAQDAKTCDVVFEAYCKVNQTGDAEPASIGEPGTVWFTDNRFVEGGRVFDAIVAGGTETANIPGDYAISEHRTGFDPSIRRVNFGGNLSVGGTIAKMSEFILKGTDVTVAKNLTLASGEIAQTGGILEVLGDFTMVNADATKANRKPKLNAYAPAVAGHTEAYFSVTTKVDGVWTVKADTVVYPYVDDSTCSANTGVPYFEANQLVLEEGAMFDARRRGWGWTQSKIAETVGLGHGGEKNTDDGHHGASHGGLGAANAKGLTKSTHKTYDSEKKPMLPGSSAKSGSYWYGGGHAGGVIRIVAEKMLLDGELNADGQNAGGGGCGGSGGSVWITAKFLSGDGAVTAKGGSGSSDHWPAGGGGRIAIYSCVNRFCDPLDPDPAHVSAARGVCYQEPPEGGADSTDGTVYFKQLKGGTMILVR